MKRGEKLSIEIDHNTPLHILENELAFLDESVKGKMTVSTMKRLLEVGMLGCETANEKLNRPIPLTGWAARTRIETPNLYDQALEDIYRMYLSGGVQNPFMSLAWALGTSAVDHVMKEYRGEKIVAPANTTNGPTFASYTSNSQNPPTNVRQGIRRPAPFEG